MHPSLTPHRIVIFCRNHTLAISIKAGGYGTAGWAVGGDIIVDLSRIVQTDIESPNEQGSFTSIKDMPQPGGKGKERAASVIPGIAVTGKRRRDEDALLRTYNAPSLSVNTLLHPGGTVEPFRPTSRRRLNDPSPSDASSLGTPDPTLPAQSISRQPAAATWNVPPSPSPLCQVAPLPSIPVTADPFGYLDEESQTPPSAVSTSQHVWSTSMFTSPAFLASGQNMLTYATPIHSHAYVTFGAGMRQKEVDQFCAANPLEAQSLAGGRSAVPYHIPLWVHLSLEI